MGDNYASKIIKLRSILNWSQTDLAKYLKTSLVSVNRWEKGHHEPTVIMKEKLKELFVKYEIEIL